MVKAVECTAPDLKGLDVGQVLYGDGGYPVQDAIRTQVERQALYTRLGAQSFPDVLVLGVGHVVYDPTVAFCCLMKGRNMKKIRFANIKFIQ